MSDQYRPLKDAFGRFATGVAIASCIDRSGSGAAITVNSFASVSLDPPLVSWCLEESASTYAKFMDAEHFAISVLHTDQRALSDHFAQYPVKEPDLSEFESWVTGAPVLKRRLAAFDCRVCDRVKAGDHVILIGEVVKFDSSDGDPLIYFASGYQTRTKLT